MKTALAFGLMVMSSPLLAHVSEAQGMVHAAEHAWLWLLFVPALFLLRPLFAHLRRDSRD